MVNNNYNHLGKDYPIGGLINGEIDNMVLTGGQEDDIYDFVIEGGYNISLSDKYGLMVQTDNKLFIAICVSEIKEGQLIYASSGIIFDGKKILSITKRRGKHISIPKPMFILNRIYVTSKFRAENFHLEDEKLKKDTCMHRSKEKVAYKIKFCCSPEQERMDYHCEARNIKLIQPVCWNCDLYKKE